MDTKNRNWLDLPSHILGFISDKLIDINDYIHFGSVCWPWRHVYTETFYQRRTHHQLPFLMIPSDPSEPEPSDFKNQTPSLYNLSQKRVLPNFHIKVPHNKICKGSTQGWLVTLDENLSEVSLFNPFLSDHNKIELPVLTTLDEDPEIVDEMFLKKLVLSANPAINPNYVVMAIYGLDCALAFFKPGDKTWTPLNCLEDILDVIYFKDKFYVLEFKGVVHSCDLTQNHPKVVTVAARPNYGLQSCGFKKYLVEASGYLLQISRDVRIPDDTPYHYTAGFEVFKLEESTLKWSKLKTVGGSAIFVGDNHSILLKSRDFPVCKPNSIYFTDDYYFYFGRYSNAPDGPHDMGVFSMKDGSIEPHYPLKINIVNPDYPYAIWIEPTLQQC